LSVAKRYQSGKGEIFERINEGVEGIDTDEGQGIKFYHEKKNEKNSIPRTRIAITTPRSVNDIYHPSVYPGRTDVYPWMLRDL